MTATDELRRLLDERGVEWGAFGDVYADQTLVHTERFGRCAVTEWPTGLDVHLFNLTPEQAVEATLGSDLKAENEKLRDELDFCLKQAPKCDGCEAMLDCWECLRADSSQKERKRLDYENGQLRELVRHLLACTQNRDCECCEFADDACDFEYDAKELGVDA